MAGKLYLDAAERGRLVPDPDITAHIQQSGTQNPPLDTACAALPIPNQLSGDGLTVRPNGNRGRTAAPAQAAPKVRRNKNCNLQWDRTPDLPRPPFWSDHAQYCRVPVPPYYYHSNHSIILYIDRINN
jgi:hypothetical protein